MSISSPTSANPGDRSFVDDLAGVEHRTTRARGPELTVDDLRFGRNELINSAEVTQNFAKTVEKLERGEAERYIITSRNEFRAILVSMEHYLRLLNAAR